VEALDDVAELAPGTRAWFVERYGVGRDVGAYARLRDVLVMPRSPRGAPGEAAWHQIAGLPRPALDGLELLASGTSLAPAPAMRAACAARSREQTLHERTLARVTARAAEARVRGMQREYGARVTGVGPLRPELVEERVTRRRARLLTRIRITDATRDPFVEWLAGRGGSC
jgi:hypothetical protein